MFQDAAKQFYHRKYKPRKTLLYLVRISVDPFGKGIRERNKFAHLVVGRMGQRIGRIRVVRHGCVRQNHAEAA